MEWWQVRYDADRLEDLYWGEGLSVYDIADRFDVAEATARKQMDEHGIDRRGQSEAYQLARENDRPGAVRLETMYWDWGLSLREMAEMFDVSAPTVRRWMKSEGIERR